MAKNNVFRKILLRVNKLVKGYDLDPIAEEAASRVKKRTRLGFGVSEGKRGGKREKLPALSSNYKASRKKKKDLNKKVTSASKSNLTYSGQLLDSIRGMAKGRKIEIFFKENRNDGIKNVDLMKWQEEKKRYFFELTNKEIKALRNQIKKDLIKELRKK